MATLGCLCLLGAIDGSEWAGDLPLDDLDFLSLRFFRYGTASLGVGGEIVARRAGPMAAS